MSQILQKVAPIGESRDKELLKAASTYVFSDKEGIGLLAHVFAPEGATVPGRPAVAFFHGGFWDTPMVTQFVPHCHHFASRGAVTVAFEYRVSSKHQTGPVAAIKDGGRGISSPAARDAEGQAIHHTGPAEGAIALQRPSQHDAKRPALRPFSEHQGGESAEP